MNSELAEKLHELQQGPQLLLRELLADSPIILFLLLILLCSFLIILAIRHILYRSKKLTNQRCPACGSDLKRIRQSGWLQVILPLFSLRTLYCSSCRIKALRLKPRPIKIRRKRRRRRPAPSV